MDTGSGSGSPRLSSTVKVLILDEPINGLDPIQIAEMRDLILSLKGEHTVILSSHILSEITRTCDRILVIDQGQLVAEGTERELTESVSGNLVVEVEGRQFGQGLLDAIGQIDGLDGLSKGQKDELTTLSIKCHKDIRSQIAKVIIDQGGELLGLRKEGAELESLFIKLIQSGERL